MRPPLPARPIPAEPQFLSEPNVAPTGSAPPATPRSVGPRASTSPAAGGTEAAPAPTATASEGLFVPTGYEPGYAYPLLVWLPDARRPRFDLGRTMSRVSLRNHVAVVPARDPHPEADREALVWQAIDHARDRVSIHPRRIFLVGHGGGGTEAFRIACRHAGTFAGVVSIGGPFPLGEGLFGRLGDIRRLPMLLCCHRQAPLDVIGPTDPTLRLFHAAGAMLAMRIYPGRNHLSRTILADVNRWLMDEICGTSTVRQAPCGA